MRADDVPIIYDVPVKLVTATTCPLTTGIEIVVISAYAPPVIAIVATAALLTVMGIYDRSLKEKVSMRMPLCSTVYVQLLV